MKPLENIFKSDGKTFVLAMDHSLVMQCAEMDRPAEIIGNALEGGVDAFLASYGVIHHFRECFGDAGLIMRADGGATILNRHEEPLRLLYNAADAHRIGADALMCMGYPGSAVNAVTLSNVASIVRDAHSSGLAAGAEMLPYGFGKIEGVETRSVENVEFACRLGAEMGADFVKTEFVGGDLFREVVRRCFVPVLVLGGGKARTREEIVRGVRDAMKAGASGVIMGRNIVRSPDMKDLCREIAEIIHG